MIPAPVILAAMAFWSAYPAAPDPCNGQYDVQRVALPLSIGGQAAPGRCLIEVNDRMTFDGLRGLCVVVTHEMGHVRGVMHQPGIMDVKTPSSTPQCDKLPRARAPR